MCSGIWRMRPLGCSRLLNFKSADTAIRTSPFSTRTARSGDNKTLIPRRKRISMNPRSFATGPNSRRKTIWRLGSQSNGGGLLFCKHRDEMGKSLFLLSYSKSWNIKRVVGNAHVVVSSMWRRHWWESGSNQICLLINIARDVWQRTSTCNGVPDFCVDSKLEEIQPLLKSQSCFNNFVGFCLPLTAQCW